MRFYVIVKEEDKWEECGEGPLTQKQAERIAFEIRRDCRVPAKAITVFAWNAYATKSDEAI